MRKSTFIIWILSGVIANCGHFIFAMSRTQALVFQPKKLGRITVQNRFMRSGTWEGLADHDGRPTDDLFAMLEKLGHGGVGLIVTGACYCSKKAQNRPNMSGMCTPEQARMWRRGVEKIQAHGSKLVFQISHSGRTADPSINGGFEPMVPTALSKNEREMTNAEIEETIQEFCDAAELAAHTGAAGVQLHAAHGMLLSAFLSPALNKRADKWGGSEENRLRIVQEIVAQIRKVVPENFALMIKMNGNDYVDGGVTPQLAARYVKQLADKIDLFEISSGLSINHIMRTVVNEEVLCRYAAKSEQQSLTQKARQTFTAPFEELYNRDALKVIREMNPTANLALVGGARSFDKMDELISSGDADIVSMSRPFINDPYLMYRLRGLTLDKVLCISCSACLLNCKDGMFCHLKGK